MNLSKYLRTYLHQLTDLKKLDHQVHTKPRDHHPIVSLTSVPKRLELIKATLISLLKQTIPPQEIHINLGEDLFANHPIPDFLQQLKVIKIFWVKKDCGPATKYIPTLERFSKQKQLLIICDDDMYYAPDLIESLVAADKQSLGQNSYCINGLKVPADFKSESRPSDKAIKSGQKQVAIIEGCGGYTLRSQFVDVAQLTHVQGAPERCFFDDDIWLSGHLSRNKILKYQITAGKRKSLVNTIESAISGDRAQLQTNLMNYFKNDWAPQEIEPKQSPLMN